MAAKYGNGDYAAREPEQITFRLAQYPDIRAAVIAYRNASSMEGNEITFRQAVIELLRQSTTSSASVGSEMSGRQEAYRKWSRYIKTELMSKLEEIATVIRETPYDTNENKKEGTDGIQG